IAHRSSAAGLSAAEEALAVGTAMTLETCPQFLWLTEDDYVRLGTWMKMNPPVRTLGDRSALRDGLRRGVIAMVATDHAPHTDAEKNRDLEHAPPGSPGVQTLYLSCLELARELGDVWMAPRWVCEAPAALAGLTASKGCIAPGFDADVVVVDPGRSTTFGPRMMRSRQRHGALKGVLGLVHLASDAPGEDGGAHKRMVRDHVANASWRVAWSVQGGELELAELELVTIDQVAVRRAQELLGVGGMDGGLAAGEVL